MHATITANLNYDLWTDVNECREKSATRRMVSESVLLLLEGGDLVAAEFYRLKASEVLPEFFQMGFGMGFTEG